MFELFQSVFLLWFLRVRGWTLEKFGLQITWRGTGMGWLLLLTTYVVTFGTQFLLQSLAPLDMPAARHIYPQPAPSLSLQLVFLTRR